METMLLVVTQLPDSDSARKVVEVLIGQRLAACVSIQAPCLSVYRWQGKIENTQEIPVFVKTTEDRYAAVEAAIRANHPYELPEIVALPVTHGLPGYLAWIGTETRP